ncbi:4'-phosphopantetheinyl transferase superfamily protein [Sphingomonas sp. LB2R24]|uniref:4'-phosphopantetheinyl transferase family protein n=1 Tax=Sphingomonas sorbitolis TaxID=3096165 RepID=UPI002FC6ED94
MRERGTNKESTADPAANRYAGPDFEGTGRSAVLTEIASHFPPGVGVATLVPEGCNRPLFLEEKALIVGTAEIRRHHFTAGRTCAREALRQIGGPAVPLLRSANGAPIWPSGYVGSITHSQGICCAVAASALEVEAVGIDAELLTTLDLDVVRMICRPNEMENIAALSDPNDGLWPLLTFSAKEAFYKCFSSITDHFLEFRDVSVRFCTLEPGKRGTFSITIEAPAVPNFGLAQRVFGSWCRTESYVFTAVLSAAIVST